MFGVSRNRGCGPIGLKLVHCTGLRELVNYNASTHLIFAQAAVNAPAPTNLDKNTAIAELTSGRGVDL